MGKMMKIDFVNKGEEFELPVVSSESDIQMTIDLLKIQVKVEKEIAKELGLNVSDMRKELLKAQMDKDYVLSDDAKSWNSIMAIQLNLDTAYYVLSKIDPTVTKHQVSTLGGTRLAEIVMAIFPTPEAKPEDFQKATETVANSG
jgi:hypothetical protein